MTALAELRLFARDTIPALLLEAGGQMNTRDMHTRLEQMFAASRLWPVELNRLQRGGCSVGRNAIAWAVTSLENDGVLASSAGQPTMRLAGLPTEPRRSAQVRDVRSYAKRIKVRAVERARICRGRARREGVPFDEAFVLSAADEIERQAFRCAATSIPFDLDPIGEGTGAVHFAPSPDRVVPAHGYVPGNVRWVLWLVKRAKRRMTDVQFRMMCHAVLAGRS
jgi:hypothetical protein